DSAAVEELFRTYTQEIAAIIVEPIAANMGLVLPLPGFLEKLRKLTREYGALLIFDEVMTGFRVALGGMQERVSITPDLTCLGKIIGGGLPVGAYGGRREIMERVLHDTGLGLQFVRLGAMFCLYFTPEPVIDYATAKTSNTAQFAQYFWYMLAHGIYLPPSQFEACFISLALNDEMIEETVK